MNKPTEKVSNNANQQQPQQAQCFESDVTDTRLQYGLKTEPPPPLHVDRQSNRFSNDVSGTINYQQPFTSSHSHFSQSPSFSNNLNNPPPQTNSSNFYSNRPYLSPERGIGGLGGIEQSPPPPAAALPLINNSNNIPPSNTTSLPYTTHSIKNNSTHEYPTSNNASYMHHASSNLLPQPNNNPYSLPNSSTSSNYSNPEPTTRNQTLLPSINQVVNRNIPGTALSFTQGQEQHYLIPPSSSIGNIPIRNTTPFPTNNDRDNTCSTIELSNTNNKNNNNNGSSEIGIMSGNGNTILSNNYYRTAAAAATLPPIPPPPLPSLPSQQHLHDASETTMPPQQQQQQQPLPYYSVQNNMHVGYQQQHHGDGSVSSSSANDPQIFQTTQQQQYYPSIPSISIPSIQQVQPSHQFHVQPQQQQQQQQQIRTVNTTAASSTSGSGSTSTPNTPVVVVQSGNSTAVVMNERKIPQPSSHSNQYSNQPHPYEMSSTTLVQNNSGQKQHESLYHDFYVPPIKKKTNEGKNTNPLFMNNNLNHNNNTSSNLLGISNSQLVDSVVVGGSIVPLCSLCDRKITKRYWVRDCNVGVMRSFSKNEAIVGNSCCKACYTKARKIIKSQKPTLSTSTINENTCGSTNCTLDHSSTLINSNNGNSNNNNTTTTTSSSVSSSVTESETPSTPDDSQIGNTINSSLTHSETPTVHHQEQQQHQILTRDVLEELGQVLSGKLPMMTNNYSSQKIGKNKKKYDLHVDKIEEENEIVFNIKLKVNKK